MLISMAFLLGFDFFNFENPSLRLWLFGCKLDLLGVLLDLSRVVVVPGENTRELRLRVSLPVVLVFIRMRGLITNPGYLLYDSCSFCLLKLIRRGS